jgi:hypothetical protein
MLFPFAPATTAELAWLKLVERSLCWLTILTKASLPFQSNGCCPWPTYTHAILFHELHPSILNRRCVPSCSEHGLGLVNIAWLARSIFFAGFGFFVLVLVSTYVSISVAQACLLHMPVPHTPCSSSPSLLNGLLLLLFMQTANFSAVLVAPPVVTSITSPAELFGRPVTTATLYLELLKKQWDINAKDGDFDSGGMMVENLRQVARGEVAAVMYNLPVSPVVLGAHLVFPSSVPAPARLPLTPRSQVGQVLTVQAPSGQLRLLRA